MQRSGSGVAPPPSLNNHTSNSPPIQNTNNNLRRSNNNQPNNSSNIEDEVGTMLRDPEVIQRNLHRKPTKHASLQIHNLPPINNTYNTITDTRSLSNSGPLMTSLGRNALPNTNQTSIPLRQSPPLNPPSGRHNQQQQRIPSPGTAPQNNGRGKFPTCRQSQQGVPNSRGGSMKGGNMTYHPHDFARQFSAEKQPGQQNNQHVQQPQLTPLSVNLDQALSNSNDVQRLKPPPPPRSNMNNSNSARNMSHHVKVGDDSTLNNNDNNSNDFTVNQQSHNGVTPHNSRSSQSYHHHNNNNNNHSSNVPSNPHHSVLYSSSTSIKPKPIPPPRTMSMSSPVSTHPNNNATYFTMKPGNTISTSPISPMSLSTSPVSGSPSQSLHNSVVSTSPLPNTSMSSSPSSPATSSSTSLAEKRRTIILQMEDQWSEDEIFTATESECVDNDDFEDDEEEEEVLINNMEEENDHTSNPPVVIPNTNSKYHSNIIAIPNPTLEKMEDDFIGLEVKTAKRVSVRKTSSKQGDWEGWQRRVKRQTWEEWESNFMQNTNRQSTRNSSMIGVKNDMEIVANARDGEIDGRAVAPYWLLKWWLTKNTTQRPTLSRHPLLELLLEDNLSLVTALSEVLKNEEANQFAFYIVRVFEGCCKIMPLITHFIKREVEVTIHGNTLFRTNTMATKIMSAYAKIAGGNYLRKLLYPIIHFIIEQNFNIEIDEKKLREDSKPIGEQIELLLKITQQFYDHIVQQAALVPLMFRRICHCLLILVKEKFQDDNQYHGVGGFLFLRFICPAIVTPDACGIIKTKLTPGVRRTLVLISKVLQNLANGIKHAKEEYMTPTDIFIEQNNDSIHAFLDSLSEISDLTQEENDYVGIIPVPLVEESLSVIHRLVINHIDELKDELNDKEETEIVPYNIAENLKTVILKSNMAIELLKNRDTIDESSPLYKPYFLFIDAILASGCYIVRNLLASVQSDMDSMVISESLMAIVHTHGNSLEYIKQYIMEEVNRAEDISLAFATMNISNHIIWGYFRVLTRDFIHSIWGEIIIDINSQNKNLEIDPVRAAKISDQVIEYNTNSLIKICKLLVDKLFFNVGKLHPRVCELCEFIQAQITAKFGGEIDKLFSARLIAKRIFATALSYPAAFHLLRNLPAFNARRTCILASKVLSNILFHAKSKEAYMTQLNNLGDEYFQKADMFLEKITQSQKNIESTFSLSARVQSESLTCIHTYLTKHLPAVTDRIKEKNAEETTIYKLFDRLAAVIALYRYQLRKRRTIIQK